MFMWIQFNDMDERAAREIVRWRYEPPYDVYDLADRDEQVRELVEPHAAFRAMRDESGELVGFCSFGEDGRIAGGDYDEPALDIGMGIRPTLTGQGLGREFVAAVLDEARARAGDGALRVTIASFNERARRVWAVAGFEEEQEFKHATSARPFVVMTCRAPRFGP